MNSSKSIKSITIAGLRGGSGKTITSLGIVRALSRKGMKVACFKKGPDYIDAAWLGRAAGSPCHNLDQFLMDDQTIVDSFASRAFSSDIAVIEGNRGLFDGVDVEGSCSTAQLAKLLDSSVVLVVDCTKVTRTAAALVLGCMNLDPDVRITGIILNQVAGKRHRKILTKAIETYTGLPVFGAIPRMKTDPLPMRHLGLTPAYEFKGVDRSLDELADLCEREIDLEGVLELSMEGCTKLFPGVGIESLYPLSRESFPGLRIGVIKDAAFQFYYPENLEAIEHAGAEIVILNALSDTSVPEIHGLYIGGGFPETQAESLSANKGFMQGLREFISAGLPVYAECGGLIYLGRNLFWRDRTFPMTGVLDLDFILERRPVGHGYSIIEFVQDSPFYKKGKRLTGHEFHYSQPVPVPGENPGKFCCKVIRGHGFDGKSEGYCRKNVFGSYTHIHALGERGWAETFLRAARAQTF